MAIEQMFLTIGPRILHSFLFNKERSLFEIHVLVTFSLVSAVPMQARVALKRDTKLPMPPF